MRNGTWERTVVLAAVSVLVVAHAAAQQPKLDLIDAAILRIAPSQRLLELPVCVVDKMGNPVPDAKVTPWALRSSLGHGPWWKDDETIGVSPSDATTDAEGMARVLYPCYHDAKETVRTIAVSLRVDHPGFAYRDNVHIDVPLDTDGTAVIELGAGVPLDVRPLEDGQPARLDSLFAFWSCGRSHRLGASPEKRDDGTLRFPAMAPGPNSVLLVRLDGDRATHFSRIVDFELAVGEPARIDVVLRPSACIEGKLSDNVPRPVRNGRVQAQTLTPVENAWGRVSWFTWVPVQADGTFSIDWPADEPIQLIALCDGYAATGGRAPAGVAKRGDAYPHCRPQVFGTQASQPLELAMSPLAECTVTTVDEDDQPVAGVRIASSPGVGWWRGGIQIYAHPLVRGERVLRAREYYDAVDDTIARPYEAETGAEGQATLWLPGCKQPLVVASDVYELPVFLGRRNPQIEVRPGAKFETVLRLQPRGSEKLGEWDKLAGVVFGCTTREGRRICALPGVRKQMDEFVRRFREGKNRRDPKLLSEAYTLVADAFAGVGDPVEAAKWRRKAAQQAELAKQPRGE